MIRSMTGYGEASGDISGGTLRVEIRTVNHRYLNVNARLPGSYQRIENELKDWLKGPLSRGHVNLTVRLEADDDEDENLLEVDHARVRNYLKIFRELRDEYDLGGKADLAFLARYGDIIQRADSDKEEAPEIPVDQIREVVLSAADQVVEMREEEGKRLFADLRGRIDAMEAALGAIEERAPERLSREKTRLTAAIGELLDGTAPDPDRLAQEIAILAERWDINEELVRFRSHNELFMQMLNSEGAEPVGKRLSFLVQEMHREANTIGSKANDSEISHRVVSIKDELERLREQVENVE